MGSHDLPVDVLQSVDFNVQEAVQALGGISQAEYISRSLESRLHFVDNEIRQHVTEHYEDLISSSTGIQRVENVLSTLQSKSTSLSLSISRVKTKVDDSFFKAQAKVQQLENMQSVCDSLRMVIRVLFIGRRLQQQLENGDRDLPKAAQSVWQLDQLFVSSSELKRIEVCIPVERLANEAAQKIKVRLTELLQKGLIEENHNTLGSVFQAYYHLNQLTSCLGSVVEQLKKNLSSEVSKHLSVNQLNRDSTKSFGPGKANMPITGNSAMLRTNLWNNTEKIVTLCVSSIQKFHFVVSLLSKKKDSTTNYLSFLELIAADNEDLVSLQSYFKFVQSLIRSEYNKCASNSSALKQIIESEYPKFLKSLLSLRDKTNLYCDLYVENAPGISDYSSQDSSVQTGWKTCLEEFQSSYLSRSLSRLFDPVNLAFSKKDTKLPTADEISAIIGVITTELSVVMFDADLTLAVCKNVSKTLNLFAIKAEEILPSSSPECWQLLLPLNETQQFMINIANTVYAFRNNSIEALDKMSLSLKARNGIKPSLDKLESAVVNIIQTWLGHAQNYIKDIIKTMHKEKYVLDFSPSSEKTSLYIRELNTFTGRVYQSYLNKFSCHLCLEMAMSDVIKRCSEFLMMHIAMLNDVNEFGLMLIANDIEQFENCMKQLYPASDYTFKSIRLFSSALKFDTGQLVDLLRASDLLKPSVLLMLMFSRAHPEVTQPHLAADMDNLDMSKWFEQHPQEKDRIAFFNSGLEAYVQRVRTEGAKEYSKYYPFLRTMMEVSFDKVSSSHAET